MGILSDISIADLTYGTAGPLALQLLADMGANIVRVDTPADRVREQQGSFVRLRGRRSIYVDLGAPGADEVLRRLIDRSDVVISEPGLDAKPPLPGDFASLSATNPRLIHCRITAYGDEGPLVDGWAHDHLVAARYGVYDQPGWREGPTFLPSSVPSLGAALLAVQGIGTALYLRERSGRGQEVSTSLLAGALSYQPGMVSAAISRPMAATGFVGRSPLGAAPFYSIYECGDGNWLHFACLTQAFQLLAIAAIGIEEELKALGFGTPAGMEARAKVIDAITARMKEKPFAEWATILEAADVPYAPSQWTEDLLDDPQVRHAGLLVTINDPVIGPVEQMGPVVGFSSAPWAVPDPAPLPGEHSDEICRGLGFDAAEIETLRRAGAVR